MTARKAPRRIAAPGKDAAVSSAEQEVITIQREHRLAKKISGEQKDPIPSKPSGPRQYQEYKVQKVSSYYLQQ